MVDIHHSISLHQSAHAITPDKYDITIHGKPYPDNKVFEANMGPTWGQQDLTGPNVGPMNLVIWLYYSTSFWTE